MSPQRAALHTMPQLTTCILWDFGKWFLLSYPKFPHLQRSVCHKGELKKMYMKNLEKVTYRVYS